MLNNFKFDVSSGFKTTEITINLHLHTTTTSWHRLSLSTQNITRQAPTRYLQNTFHYNGGGRVGVVTHSRRERFALPAEPLDRYVKQCACSCPIGSRCVPELHMRVRNQDINMNYYVFCFPLQGHEVRRQRKMQCHLVLSLLC